MPSGKDNGEVTVTGGTRLLWTGGEEPSLWGDTGPKEEPRKGTGWLPGQRTAGGPAKGRDGSTGGQARGRVAAEEAPRAIVGSRALFSVMGTPRSVLGRR